MLLEVPVFDIQSALKAQRAGAHRIELCISITEGGITPSQGMILKAKELLDIPFFVMIRPRGGNFFYSLEEIDTMINDIEFCKLNGIYGIVIGVLTENGKVDKEVCKKLLGSAENMKKTFHRAFDRTVNPFDALEDIIECGFDRILTSGQKETAPEGVKLIAELNKQAAERIIIMPGSGVDENNLEHLHSICGCSEYHSSAKIKIKTNQTLILTSDAEEIWTVSEEKIRKMLDTLRKLSF